MQMTQGEPLRVVGLCGSLRPASYNRAALEEAGRQMPAGMRLDIVPWVDVPLYGANDVEADWPRGA